MYAPITKFAETGCVDGSVEARHARSYVYVPVMVPRAVYTAISPGTAEAVPYANRSSRQPEGAALFFLTTMEKVLAAAL